MKRERETEPLPAQRKKNKQHVHTYRTAHPRPALMAKVGQPLVATAAPFQECTTCFNTRELT